MDFGTYLNLIIFTAGTLIYLFLLVLFAGMRRPRLFESLLFLTGVSLFLYFASGLLSLNLRLYYDTQPQITRNLSRWLGVAGLAAFPTLLIHTHVEYWHHYVRKIAFPLSGVLSGLAYGPGLVFMIYYPVFEGAQLWMEHPSYPVLFLALWSGWFGFGIVVAAVLNWRVARLVSDTAQKQLHRLLAAVFSGLASWALLNLCLVGVLVWTSASQAEPPNWLRTVGQVTDFLGQVLLLLPGAVLSHSFLRQRLLPLGVQRHVVLTVTGAFLALLYLTLALRVSDWLADYLPPVATLSILLFVLVIFFEPLQRRVGAVLGRAFRQEAERLQKLTAEIQQVARSGDLNQLIAAAESRMKENFALADARIVLPGVPERPPIPSSRVQRFPMRGGAEEIGAIEAHFFGLTLSGETFAALSYLSEQLPAALDLCRLIDEKLRLERELAERERLALVGQMAASISHNLKNPLSSMKTLLQVQLENPELPAPIRKDCELVVEEIDRLSAKLGQLLQFARPAVRSGVGALKVDVAALAEQAVGLLRHEADRRGVTLEFTRHAEEVFVWGSEPALSDVLSNLLVNGIEAVPNGGKIRVAIESRGADVALEITDDGPGISPEQQAKIYQPFFTTKSRGTGLGLAIVERRLAELKGTITCTSPVANNGGTRFTVTLPPAV